MKEQDKDKDIKQFLGMPMRWNRKKMFKDLWNPDEDRIFPPKQFGIGWGLNFHALLREFGFVKKKAKTGGDT